MHVPTVAMSHFDDEVIGLSPVTRVAVADADRVLHALKDPGFRLHGAEMVSMDEVAIEETVRFALRSLGVSMEGVVLAPLHMSVTRVSNPVWATKLAMRNVAGAMLRGSIHQMMVEFLERRYEEALLSKLGFSGRKQIVSTVMKALPDTTPYGDWKDGYIIGLSKVVLLRYLMLAATDDERVEELRPLVAMLPYICLIGRMKAEQGMPTRWVYGIH